jgi:hypothetical protein
MAFKTPAILLLATAVLTGQDVRPVGPQSVTVPVDVMADPSQNLWRVSRAWLSLNFHSTEGYVRITNVSSIPFNSARFYAEYYDDAGRLCFTLVFVQDRNLDGIRGPFSPGETRTLSAIASVAPGVRPRRVRLWFLDEAGAPEPPHAEVIAPVTVRDGTIGTVEGIHLSELPNQPLIPLALVDATSESRDMRPPASFKVVAARDESSRQWATELVSKLRFAPATHGWEPVASRTLILIRVLSPHPSKDIPAAPAFEDPWVRLYVAASSGNSPPPIVNLLRIWSEEGSDMFRYFSVGTDWCLPVFRWVPDPIHGGTHREWLPDDDL